MNAIVHQPEAWEIWLRGFYEDPDEVNKRFDWLQENCHFVSSSAICPPLPQGFAIRFNIKRVDAKTETYRVGAGGALDDEKDDGSGKRGLGGVALFRLANAAEISWYGDRSYRADDGKEPYYCHWHAVGVRRLLSGEWKVFDDDCRFDLREGGAQWRKIMESVRGTAYGGKKRTAEEIREIGLRQVRDTQAKILEKAQTGAKLRAIRKTLEIRTYDEAELQKPWVIAMLAYTGKNADPRVEQKNLDVLRDRFLVGATGLFAADSAPRARALPPKPPTAYQLPPVEMEDNWHEDPPSDPGPIEDFEVDPIDAEGRVVGCEYCGALDGVQFVTTHAGDVPVCSDKDCVDKAMGGVSRQAQKVVDDRPPPPAASRPKSGSTPPPPGMSRASDLPPPPRGTRPETHERRHGNGPQPRSGFKIERGRDAGKDIEDLSPRQLEFWRDRLAKRLRDGETPPQYVAKDTALLNAIRNELASRAAPY